MSCFFVLGCYGCLGIKRGWKSLIPEVLSHLINRSEDSFVLPAFFFF
jgi:hypothetical protein